MFTENKGADQLRGYPTVQLILAFVVVVVVVFSKKGLHMSDMTRLIFYVIRGCNGFVFKWSYKI